MTPLDFIFWATEFVLEFQGAYFSLRRKIWPLFAYLYFRVLADGVCFGIFFISRDAYYWADWWQRAIQYPLMYLLLIYAIGTILKADVPSVRLYCALFVSFCVLAVGASRYSATSAHDLLRFELFGNMLFCSALCLALAMRKEVKAPWGAISAGVLIQVGSEAVLTLGLLKGIDTSKLYPLGAIAALGMWVWAVRPKYQLKEARLNLGVR